MGFEPEWQGPTRPETRFLLPNLTSRRERATPVARSTSRPKRRRRARPRRPTPRRGRRDLRRGCAGCGRIACASCHQPGKHFADGRVVGRGAAALDRNTPSVVGAAYSRWLYWDGRRDSAWSQALAPIESPSEMGGTRVGAVLRVARDHGRRGTRCRRRGRRRSTAPSPASARRSPLTSAASWPGRPPSIATWRRSSAATARARPVARPVRRGGPAHLPLRRRAVPPVPRRPAVHQRRVSQHRDRRPGSPGRPARFRALDRHPGPARHRAQLPRTVRRRPGARLSRGPILDRHEQNGTLVGAYKVPGLRNAAATAPFMHDGRFATLIDAIGHYRRPTSSTAPIEFRPLFDMTPQQVAALAAFVAGLSAPVAAPPCLLRAPPPRSSGCMGSRSAPSPSSP